VTYSAFNYEEDLATFAKNLSDFRNAIVSQVGYQRLTDTFHPDEYRMAIYTDGLEIDPIKYNTASEFELKFNCKPQRWLTSGEVPVTIGEWGATKEASGEIVTIESEGGEAAKSLVVTLEPIQAGSGDPSPDNVRPISGRTEVNTIVSPTTSASDGRTYTTSLGRTVYGGTLDVVSGVLTVDYAKYVVPSDISVTDRITAQNRVYWEFADMASGTYLNDDMVVCNLLKKATPSGDVTQNLSIAVGANSKYVYLQGLTHLSGVTDLATFRTWLANNPIEFTYKLATPQTYQLTPQQVTLLVGENHLWSDGAITMQYGDDPDSLWNPTQYDAGPLLAIEGNGNISFNGYTVAVDAGEYGRINVKVTKILSDPITYSTKTELYNSGDTIEIFLELHWELISARSPRATRVSNLQNTGDGQTETEPFSNGSLKGTTIIDTFFFSSQDTTLTNVFSCDVEFSNGHTATTTLTLEVVWDSANSTLSFHTTPSGHGRWGRVVRTYPTSIIEAVSSKTYLGNPTYVDCELGEAYKIEDGEIVSLNKYIELGSDLPKLSSGANDVTISNTVTELKVTPNWWKL
jgi:phage-related protein